MGWERRASRVGGGTFQTGTKEKNLAQEGAKAKKKRVPREDKTPKRLGKRKKERGREVVRTGSSSGDTKINEDTAA